ncbi:hypothetical protein ACROYT_G019325 [Oculina patagonica]
MWISAKFTVGNFIGRMHQSEDMGTIIIMQRRWRWIGHVIRKENESITKTALYWTPEGRRKRGRPKNTWQRTVETELRGLKPKLEHHPTAGQRQTAVEDLCCCPACQWAQWAVRREAKSSLKSEISNFQ